MAKKTMHILEKNGWIRRVEKGRYVCRRPSEVMAGMVSLKVPDLLKNSGKEYSYTKASAVEVWTDYTYIQRSWEHSPYYIKVLEEDVEFWTEYFNRHGIGVYVENAEPVLGEFVVLIPVKKIRASRHGEEPVDSLRDTVKYCEKNIYSFEYPLAYLIEKYNIKTNAKVDERLMSEISK